MVVLEMLIFELSSSKNIKHILFHSGCSLALSILSAKCHIRSKSINHIIRAVEVLNSLIALMHALNFFRSKVTISSQGPHTSALFVCGAT